MKTEIRELDGQDAEIVSRTILVDHCEIYGYPKANDLIAARFNGIYTDKNQIAGFYATCSYLGGKDIVICFVYIFEEHRRKGLFNKIVNHVKSEYSKADTIGIWATKNNYLAHVIYSKKFTRIGYDTRTQEYYYLIENRKKFEKCLK